MLKLSPEWVQMIAIINNWQSEPFEKLSSWQAWRKNRTSLASNCTASWLNYCEQSQIAKVTTLINSRAAAAARMQSEPIFPVLSLTDSCVPAIACSGRQVIPGCKLPLSKRRMKWFRTEQTVDLFARFFRQHRTRARGCGGINSRMSFGVCCCLRINEAIWHRGGNGNWLFNPPNEVSFI